MVYINLFLSLEIPSYIIVRTNEKKPSMIFHVNRMEMIKDLTDFYT